MELLYEYAFKRKSFRRFNTELKITNAEIKQIENYIKNHLIKLDDEYLFTYQIVPRHRTTCKRGEYCILIYSQIDGPNLMNIGYAFEQLDLFMASIDIGACWYGMGKVDENKIVYDNQKYIIMIAIGKAMASEFRRDYKKARRKESSQIWLGSKISNIVEYVKYSPSTCNSQPWLMEYENHNIKVIMKSKEKMLVPKDKISYYNSIDMGTILCFIELWLKHNKIRYKRIITKQNELYMSGDVVAEYKLDRE